MGPSSKSLHGSTRLETFRGCRDDEHSTSFDSTTSTTRNRLGGDWMKKHIPGPEPYVIYLESLFVTSLGAIRDLILGSHSRSL